MSVIISDLIPLIPCLPSDIADHTESSETQNNIITRFDHYLFKCSLYTRISLLILCWLQIYIYLCIFRFECCVLCICISFFDFLVIFLLLESLEKCILFQVSTNWGTVQIFFRQKRRILKIRTLVQDLWLKQKQLQQTIATKKPKGEEGNESMPILPPSKLFFPTRSK